jgi:hypothetical protein
MMAIKNFWIEAEIDGRKTKWKGGPVRPNGGFRLTVYMRDAGALTKPLTVEGWANSDGTLSLFHNGNLIQRTRR